jgi:ADP-ribose pyrophosphatase YjhB (NUDIX family)
MKPIATLGTGCLLIENDQVLLAKPNYGAAKGSWIFPGGFIDPGEQIAAAALRELHEETGQFGEFVAPFCVRYRLNPSDVYWVMQVRRSKEMPLVAQAQELQDVQFLPVEVAIKSPEVRPMTRYFIECFFSKNPSAVPIPKDFADNNSVQFFK